VRDFLTARVRWLGVNWFWPLALLALPGCGLPISGLGDCGGACVFNVDPGPEPRSGVVFCQIEKPGSRHCASPQEIDDLDSLTLAAGAEALVLKQGGRIALDYSPNDCDPPGPQVVEFEGRFPEGLPVCVNCSAAASSAITALDLCIAQCEDITAPGVVPADSATHADCVERTQFAINASFPFCVENACSDAGHFSEAFDDKRHLPDPVIWVHQVGVDGGGGDGTLTRVAGMTGSFDAGADSSQMVTAGDAYVEFTASGPAATRVAGFSEGSGDTNTDYALINFSISLFKEGCFYVYEKNVQALGDVQTCSAPDAFGAFNSGDKFRVSLKDNFDGTATVSYAQVTASCGTQIDCPPFFTSLTKANYPLRVDTSFREKEGQLGAVVLVRIQ